MSAVGGPLVAFHIRLRPSIHLEIDKDAAVRGKGPGKV